MKGCEIRILRGKSTAGIIMTLKILSSNPWDYDGLHAKGDLRMQKETQWLISRHRAWGAPGTIQMCSVEAGKKVRAGERKKATRRREQGCDGKGRHF